MVGYLIAILIGVSLGLLGGGGSILTVPTLASSVCSNAGAELMVTASLIEPTLSSISMVAC